MTCATAVAATWTSRGDSTPQALAVVPQKLAAVDAEEDRLRALLARGRPAREVGCDGPRAIQLVAAVPLRPARGRSTQLPRRCRDPPADDPRRDPRTIHAAAAAVPRLAHGHARSHASDARHAGVDAGDDPDAVRHDVEAVDGLAARLATFDVDKAARDQYGRPAGFEGLVLACPRGAPCLVSKPSFSDEALRERGVRFVFSRRRRSAITRPALGISTWHPAAGPRPSPNGATRPRNIPMGRDLPPTARPALGISTWHPAEYPRGTPRRGRDLPRTTTPRKKTRRPSRRRRVSRGTDLWFQAVEGRGARVLLRTSLVRSLKRPPRAAP